MQKFCYYPGCTLKNKASELDLGAREAAKILGFELEEIPEWQCCGGVYPLNKDEITQKLGAVRALKYAAKYGNGKKLLTLCSACYNVLKQVNNDFALDEEIKQKANNYLALNKNDYEDGCPYNGDAEVVHFLEALRDDIGFDAIKSKVKNPVQKKIAAYYGCLLLRPSKVMKFDDAENPTIMEKFIEAVGGEAVKYSMRNECCGSYAELEDEICNSDRQTGGELVTNPDRQFGTFSKSEKIIKDAISHGAEIIITCCPLCMYNLKKAAENMGMLFSPNSQSGTRQIEIKYFTEILCEALK